MPYLNHCENCKKAAKNISSVFDPSQFDFLSFATTWFSLVLSQFEFHSNLTFFRLVTFIFFSFARILFFKLSFFSQFFFVVFLGQKTNHPTSWDKNKSPNLSGQTKNHQASRDKSKSPNSLGQKKVTQPLRTKKNIT